MSSAFLGDADNGSEGCVACPVLLGPSDRRLHLSTVAQELGYTSRGTAYNVVAKALREQTAEAVTDLRDLENARLDALQLTLWDAAMIEDIKAAVAVVKIVKARVHLNGRSLATMPFVGHRLRGHWSCLQV